MTARSASEEAEQAVPNAIHLPMLLLALGIMLVGTVYPLVFSRADGARRGFRAPCKRLAPVVFRRVLHAGPGIGRLDSLWQLR